MKIKISILAILISIGFIASAIGDNNAIIIKNYSTISNSQTVEYAKFNSAKDYTILNKIDLENLHYLDGSLTVDASSSLAYFIARSPINGRRIAGVSNTLFVLNSNTGEVLKKSQIQGEIISSLLIPEKSTLAILVKNRSHNSYGHNNEDISVSFFDLSKGQNSGQVKFDNLSFDLASAPFSGMVEVVKKGFNTTKTMMNLSNMTYNTKNKVLYFTATDVLGVNRLYQFDVTRKILIASNKISEDVFSIEYNHFSGKLVALYRAGNSNEIMLGELDVVSGVVTQKHKLYSGVYFETIQEGTIDIDKDIIWVSKRGRFGKLASYAFSTTTFELDELLTKVTNTTLIDVAIPRAYASNQPVNLGNAVKVYPNPALDIVNISVDPSLVLERVAIYSVTGALVKDVKVANSDMNTQLNISSLQPGVYFVNYTTKTQVLASRGTRSNVQNMNESIVSVKRIIVK